ncbi:MAG: radical SAM protein [Clostridia bacterium]|nr:radical SAM protein [Clostridia bacterium]
MKILFTAVPQWYPASPYLAAALLVGQLKGRGFDAESYDFNIEFFNDILNKDYAKKSLEDAKEFLSSAEFACDASFSDDINEKRKKTFEIRKRIVGDYIKFDGEKAERTIEKIDWAMSVIKTKELFFDPEKLYEAKDIINSALDMASLPYVPSRIMIDNFIANPVMTYDFADVDYQCKNADMNMFLPYFEQKLGEKDFSVYSLINISITDLSQIVPGLTLARLLKEKTDAKICLGGNYIYKIAPDLKKIPEIFSEYCDFFIVGDGEIASVELAEYMCGKRNIGDVHSLVYADENGNVITNKTAPLLDMDNIYYPDFDCLDFGKYLAPEPVLPVQFGKGCYWSKCTFCDFYTGQQKFDMKSVSRAVDEVEFLVNKYGFKHFNFVDEAVPPAFYNAFATELIKRNLKIYYSSFVRLEKAFTADVLQNMYNSGARYMMWGYESESPRIMELMNKGIDLSERKRILADSAKAGIWNVVTFLLGFPTETDEELQSTIDVIYDSTIVDTCVPSNFALKKNAILKSKTDSVDITEFHENGELHISYKYSSLSSTMEEVKARRNRFEKKFLEDTADRLWPHTFTEGDYLMFYLTRYGKDYVKNYRLKYKKDIPKY